MKKTIDCVVAEIGSTTTIVNAFSLDSTPTYLGAGADVTTVDSDVREGLDGALEDFRHKFDALFPTSMQMLATSSAAGGLRMSVSGLVYEMTVRAAKEAALNAGANIHMITAGRLRDDDLERLRDISPNIILISGGTDYGDQDTAFDNLVRVLDLDLDIPVIYAGNVENHYRIQKRYKDIIDKEKLSIVDNVYPRVDYLNIHPLREKIYETFETHIVHARGMHHIRERVDGPIMPTPGAVMEAALQIEQYFGNLIVIDVGGATTDVHSIADPSEAFKTYSEGEPREKRTVEGDLGVFLNRSNLFELTRSNRFSETLGRKDVLTSYVEDIPQIPRNEKERAFIFEMARTAVFNALDRHIGDYRNIYTSSGQKVIPDGRDLTQVRTFILTGGALTQLKDTESIVREYLADRPNKLIPQGEVDVFIDHDYIMASLGVLSKVYPDKARDLLKNTLRLGDV